MLNWIATTPFPKTISTGKARGIVTKAPKTEPLLRLRAFPKTNRFKKIYELMIDNGNIIRLMSKFSVVPNEKIKLSIEIGIPISAQ